MRRNHKQLACIALFIVLALGGTTKAADTRTQLAKPRPAQIAWQEAEVGMFIHWLPEMWQADTSTDMAMLLRQIETH
jgi:hypothetical protein